MSLYFIIQQRIKIIVIIIIGLKQLFYKIYFYHFAIMIIVLHDIKMVDLVL